jgi:hypothetical protein
MNKWKTKITDKEAVVYTIEGNIIFLDDFFPKNNTFPNEHINHAEREAVRLNGNGTDIPWNKLERVSLELAVATGVFDE